MFKNSEIFSSFSVGNIENAKEFYQTILGLTVKEDVMGFLEISVKGNNSILIYPKEDHQPATFTILNFAVVDIEDAVEELNNRGIECEQYEGEITTDAKGIAREGDHAVAWFKDPAGNILSVIEDKVKNK